MRIGLIAPPWLPVPPPAYGGLESAVDRLARGLARAGHDVLLAAVSAAGDFAPSLAMGAPESSRAPRHSSASTPAPVRGQGGQNGGVFVWEMRLRACPAPRMGLRAAR